MKNGPSTSFLCIVFVEYLTTLLWAVGSINILYNIVQNSNSYKATTNNQYYRRWVEYLWEALAICNKLTMYTIQLLYKILNNNIGILFPSKMYKFMKNKQLN